MKRAIGISGENSRLAILFLFPLIAFGAYWSSWEPWLTFDRNKILAGQIWRLWSGHLAHFSPSHLGFNLSAVLVILLLLPSLTKRESVWLSFLSPALISLGLLLARPDLAIYGGLSGWASGLFGFLLIRKAQANTSMRGVYTVVLAAFCGKIVLEAAFGITFFSDLGDGVSNEPWAHFLGLVSSVGWCAFDRQSQSAESTTGPAFDLARAARRR